MWVNQLHDQRVVFKEGPTGSVWASERSVKDTLGKGHRPDKPVGTDPRTGYQVSPAQWHAGSSTSTLTWPSSVCLPALQPGRGQHVNLLFGKSMVGKVLEYVSTESCGQVSSVQWYVAG